MTEEQLIDMVFVARNSTLSDKEFVKNWLELKTKSGSSDVPKEGILDSKTSDQIWDGIMLYGWDKKRFKKELEQPIKQIKMKERILVVYDYEHKEHHKMTTCWTNKEVEGVGMITQKRQRWKVISEHESEEIAMERVFSLNSNPMTKVKG